MNFLNVAHASLAEVGYCIHVALRLGYITEPVAQEMETAIKQAGAPLAGLIRSARLNLAAKAGVAVVLIGYVVVRLA